MELSVISLIAILLAATSGQARPNALGEVPEDRLLSAVERDAVVKNNVKYYTFPSKVTINLSPQYTKYQQCLNSGRNLRSSKFATASSCRQQALKSKPASRAACNLPAALNWLEKVRSGIDVTQVDLLPLAPTSSKGLLSPVFSYTCDLGNTFSIEGKGTFTLPDDIPSLYPETDTTYSQTVDDFQTASEVRESRSSKLEISGTYKSLTAGYSQTEDTMTSTIIKESRHALETQYIASALRVNYITRQSIDNSPQSLVTSAINKIGNRPYSAVADNYHFYIRNYGTHLARWAILGGAVKIWQFTTSQYIEQNSATNATAEASLALKGLLSAKGAITTSVQKQSTAFTSSSRNITNAYGGNSASFISGPDSVSTWAASIPDKPQVIGLGLEPITSFIENPDLKAGMETAICVHIAKAYAQDLINQLGLKLDKLPSTAQQFLLDLRATVQSKYLAVLQNNGLASQHQNLCNELLTSYGRTVESELAKVTNLDPNKSTQLETKSRSNRERFVFTCPPGHTISQIKATNYNGNKHSGYDRTWSFACRPTAFSLVRLVDCTESSWTPYDAGSKLECPNNQAVAGISSEHNGSDLGDRRWMLKCCSFAANCRQTTCNWTDFSLFEKDVNYDKPHDWYLSGLQTKRNCYQVKDSSFWVTYYTKCDDAYQYKYCRVQSC